MLDCGAWALRKLVMSFHFQLFRLSPAVRALISELVLDSPWFH
jgi:hypothetical protein